MKQVLLVLTLNKVLGLNGHFTSPPGVGVKRLLMPMETTAVYLFIHALTANLGAKS